MGKLDPKVAEHICRALGGIAFTQGTPAYEAARQVWNATIDRSPLIVVRPTRTADVQKAVALAREAALAISVRGGGHNIAGTAVGDGVLMLDLSDMKNVQIDSATRIARVQGGATWSELDRAAQDHHLSVPGGIVSATGVGGLTLGGGIGWQARKHGLSVDRLLSAEVVLASGDRVTASASDHPDLFWALRGGGGNFGVVTEFTFRLHPIGPDVCFGPTFFDLTDAERVLSAYAQGADTLPREACVWANLMSAPPVPVLANEWHGRKVLTLMQFHSGGFEQAQADLAPLYGGVVPLGSAFMPRSLVEAQSFLDPVYAFGARNYWRTHNHAALSPGLISTLVGLAPDLPTPESELLICQLGARCGMYPKTPRLSLIAMLFS